MLAIARLKEEEIDVLLFVATGILPTLKISDFGVQTKGEAREAVRRLFQNKEKLQPQRLDSLSPEYDNLLNMAMRLGYPHELLTPEARRAAGLRPLPRHDEAAQKAANDRSTSPALMCPMRCVPSRIVSRDRNQWIVFENAFAVQHAN